MYADNDYKTVVVLNKRIELPQLLNALGHMTQGLGSQLTGESAAEFLDYRDANGGAHPGINKFPLIVLQSKNSGGIRKFRKALLEEDMLYSDFTQTMLGSSAEHQLAQTAASPEEELEYFGICAFGPAEKLDPLTKRFSLFRGSS